jgi:hypothetical protein
VSFVRFLRAPAALLNGEERTWKSGGTSETAHLDLAALSPSYLVRAILNDTRRDLAATYIRDTELAFGEIACWVASCEAFQRTFKHGAARRRARPPRSHRHTMIGPARLPQVPAVQFNAWNFDGSLLDNNRHSDSSRKKTELMTCG